MSDDPQPIEVHIHRTVVAPTGGGELNPFLPPAVNEQSAAGIVGVGGDDSATVSLTAGSLDSSATTTGEATAALTLTRHQTRAASYLGVCFCLLFSAFQPAQAFGATLHPDTGIASLAILYGVLTIACLFAPSLIAAFGLRAAFGFASLPYVLFVIGLIPSGSALLYVASACMGVGGAVVWIAQGVYIHHFAYHPHPASVRTAAAAHTSADAKQCSGQLNGLFFAYYNGSAIIGYALSAIVLGAGASTVAMLWVLAGVGLVGVGLFWLIPNAVGPLPATVSAGASDAPATPRGGDTELSDGSTPTPSAAMKWSEFWSSVRAQFGITYAALKSVEMLLLLPLVVLHGLNGAFVYGIFPSLVGTASGDGTSHIPFVFAVFGVGSIGFSRVWGIVLDRSRYGWKAVLVPIAVVTSLNYIGLLALPLSVNSESDRVNVLAFYYITSLVLSVSDSVNVVLTNSTINAFFGSTNAQPTAPGAAAASSDITAPTAFSCYRLVSALSFCIGFILRLYGGTSATLTAALISLVIACGAYYKLRARRAAATATAATTPSAAAAAMDSDTPHSNAASVELLSTTR